MKICISTHEHQFIPTLGNIRWHVLTHCQIILLADNCKVEQKWFNMSGPKWYIYCLPIYGYVLGKKKRVKEIFCYMVFACSCSWNILVASSWKVHAFFPVVKEKKRPGHLSYTDTSQKCCTRIMIRIRYFDIFLIPYQRCIKNTIK
jgi:hypothetical protein